VDNSENYFVLRITPILNNGYILFILFIIFLLELTKVIGEGLPEPIVIYLNIANKMFNKLYIL